MLTLTFVINIANKAQNIFQSAKVNVNNNANFPHWDMVMNRETKKYYLLLSGLLFFFFFTWSSSFSLIAIWLHQKIGLKGAETGLIFSAMSLMALFIQPLYGFIQDKLGLRKHLLLFIGVLLVLTGPFFIYAYAPLLRFNLALGALVGGVFISLAFNAGIGVLESYTERVSRIVGFEFGRARMWGSLGWASATFFAGFIYNINPNINFWLASGSAVLFLLLLSQVQVLKPNAMAALEYGKPDNLRLQDALDLLRLPRFWALVVFVIGTSVYGVFDQQFPVYFASQFSSAQQGNEMYGFLNSLQVFLEAGGMFLAPLLVNRIGIKQSLLLASSVMALRMFGSGLASGAIMISAMKLLHAVELPILLVALFKYITSRFDSRLSSTLYLVGFQFIGQVAASFLAPLAGYGYDHIGFADTYLLMGCAVACTTLLSCFLLRGESADGKPNIHPVSEPSQ
ncbi:Lactose-proton symport [Serratia odorifera]|uniref:Oligosaccharide:H+ symporter n=3 Tax=Serratia odorifera TaxID=618 RepID=D4E775_SEROD|nr:oligosaccharide:H+ symporter [Serratia odorifera DSM 4582]VDZ63974.1 Lactose-proton symport [Serratia odorifera]